ncbi:MAG: flagellar biosynthetic protein FliO [Clostridiales bacterium]|nr:flagellar biosynthetic protein FliO [Clostridiales bacterium]MCF8021711.1 flagellar biosynthetic protein FliO [Clostridiales bacterium]
MNDELVKALARLAVSLPVVILLAYFAIRFSLGKQVVKKRGQRRMRVLEQVSPGPKITVSLVQVGDRYYLLAHQESSTVLIKEMDELPPEIEKEDSGGDKPSILEWFNQKKQRMDLTGESKRNEK